MKFKIVYFYVFCLYFFFFIVNKFFRKKEYEEVWLVIIGKIGLGKSVIGNIIFGIKCFEFFIFGNFII